MSTQGMLFSQMEPPAGWEADFHAWYDDEHIPASNGGGLSRLPDLDLRDPWFGYELGQWTDENRAEAQIATQGRYLETGARMTERW